MRSGCGLGIGTLYMWARQDNPTRYNEILRRDLRRLIYDSKSGTHTDVARVVHHMYQYEYVCASIKTRCWYEYRNHRWHPSDSACSLRVRMSNEVWKEYVNAAGEISSRIYTLTDQEEMERLHKLVTTLHGVANKLKTTNFKDNVLRECGEMFYIEKFEERLDSNPALIGFENGVYDLDAMEFRDGRPEDYISFSTGNMYTPYDNSHPCVAGIRTYLAQVLTKPTIREYVMKLFSTFLHGAIKEQKFHIWTGSGSNSKSKLVELYEKAFGDYCCKFPITLLTMKRAASNATTSELARAKGKRFASLQEPSEGEQINCGFMKELSGGDKIMARSLFKEPIEFVPQFKMLLLCNHLPVVPSDDGGTWRRIRVVEFTSRFVDNPVDENEFPIDTELSNKLEQWKAHFMSMMIEYYKLYKAEGITEPEEVTACTREYKRQNDHIADYIHNCLDKKDGGFISLNDAFSELKAWVKDDNIPIPKMPTKADLEKYLVKALGTRMVVFMNQKGFKGWVLKNRNVLNDTEYDPLDA
jgi:P4 family phage/plasmid primase-like protien